MWAIVFWGLYANNLADNIAINLNKLWCTYQGLTHCNNFNGTIKGHFWEAMLSKISCRCVPPRQLNFYKVSFMTKKIGNKSYLPLESVQFTNNESKSFNIRNQKIQYIDTCSYENYCCSYTMANEMSNEGKIDFCFMKL